MQRIFLFLLLLLRLLTKISPNTSSGPAGERAAAIGKQRLVHHAGP